VRAKLSLKLRYGIVMAIAFVAIGATIFFFTSNRLRAFVIESKSQEYTTTAQEIAKETLDLSRPISLKVDKNYLSFISKISNKNGFENVKVAEANGILIFSPKNAEIGQSILDLAPTKKALSGQTALTDIDYKTNTAHATIPVKNGNNEVRGLLVANVSLGQELGQVNIIVAEVSGIIGVVSLAFVIILYFVFSNAESTLYEQDRSILDQSKALEEERQLDEAIMASVAESLVVINKDGQIMVFNPQAERVTGFKAADVEYRLYRKILNFTDKDGKEISKNPITEALNSGKTVKKTIQDGIFIKNQNKELTPIGVSVAPISDKTDQLRGVVATFTDISTEKELDRVKDEFVYVVAHELGNPIFALDGYLSILEDQIKRADKKTKEILTSARGVHGQLSGLVNDLLESIRSENGQLACEIEPIDLTEITKQVVENAKFKAKSKKITISYGPSKQPKVNGNEQKIKEVVTNFVDNALKYTPEGGHVDVWHDRDGEMIATHVKDNGFGMDAESQKHLFQKFYRVKTDQTKGITGTGLGLFICRQIVEKCGGKIWAESEEGKGSTFSFSLKIHK
jgi:PAS domain S-box-containing protein